MPEQTNTLPVFLNAPAAAAANDVMPSQEVSKNKIDAEPLPIQCKLSIGAPDDPLEHEADAVADKVMRMPERNFVQLKCAECQEEEEELQRKSETSFIQRKCRDCEKEDELQLKPLASSVTTFVQSKSSGNKIAGESIRSQIDSTKGGGSSMDSRTKSFMESRFGTDFSGVKIHTGNYASQMSQQLNAQAFTVGNDIYFNNGKYAPGSTIGKSLLAHELTHTIQQGNNLSRKLIQRQATYRNTIDTSTQDPTTHVWSGTMTRTMYTPARGSTPEQVIGTLSGVRIRFDPDNCRVILPMKIKFEHPSATNWPYCSADAGSPVPATPLTTAAFNALKTRIINLAHHWFDNWYTVTIPSGCSHCAGRTIAITSAIEEVSSGQDAIGVLANKQGRSCGDPGRIVFHVTDPSGDEITDDRIVHELGHALIGYLDEYPASEGNPNPSAERSDDFSMAGSSSNFRGWMLLQERHFSFVKTYLDSILNCGTTLNAVDRPEQSFEFSTMFGMGAYRSAFSYFFQLGFDNYLPLDRMRRWNFFLGSHAHLILPLTETDRTSFLLGARIGFTYVSNPSSGGLRLSAFGEAGAGTFGTIAGTAPLDTRETRRATLPYLYAGGDIGYRFAPSSGLLHSINLQAGYGSTLEAERILPEPLRNSQWFYFGFNYALNFR